MDELRGPNIQIVLHVKEGLGFGFLRTPFVVSGSLNGYMLETDPVVPSHAPVFDAELVWEADKRRFRSLRVQNVPIKVEVYTMATQGRKDKVGYLLLSLLGAQPCPSNKVVDVKYSLHRLLGVKSEGKCCHPQLLMSLSIEDRINTPTPRNELRMFHSNEVAYCAKKSSPDPPVGKSMLLTLKEYIAESKKTVVCHDLQPKLIFDEGLIQIGNGLQLFVLSFTIAVVENLDKLLADECAAEGVDCYVTYDVFTHNVTTDRVSVNCTKGVTGCAAFNQRTSLRVRSSLCELARYLAECPNLVIGVYVDNQHVGICSMDLRKLVPTDDIKQFVNNFSNVDKSLTINERCFILRCDEKVGQSHDRRPFLDIEMSLKHIGVKQENMKPTMLTARSATQLESGRKREPIEKEIIDHKSGSCTNLDEDVGEVAYTNMAIGNTARYKNASGDSVLPTNEIAELIKKMCDSFTLSQEKLLASRIKPTTSDMQVQCEANDDINNVKQSEVIEGGYVLKNESDCIQMQTSKSDTCVHHGHHIYNNKDVIKTVLSPRERDVIMQKFVYELEDWKEKQQELFKCQLKRKEEYHLDLLAKEWEKKRLELETKLSRGIEQCRNLAADLSRATDDFRLRGYRNTEREKKLLDAKKALETHYTAKYQELREASQKMEDDMNHQLKLKDMTIEEMEMKVSQLEKQVELLKNNLKNIDRDMESKYSGLTKDQTASLIQELRCVEQKLENAAQSKAFFKQQWARAVRELHLTKLRARARLLRELRLQRRTLAANSLDPIQDDEDTNKDDNQANISHTEDDFYIDILANSPILESNSVRTTTIPDFMDMYDDNLRSAVKPPNPMNDKLNDLIAERDQLIEQDNPDEDILKQLNHDIRSILLSCGT